MFDEVKKLAVPFLILLGAATKFGLVQPGPSMPDFAKPAPKAA